VKIRLWRGYHEAQLLSEIQNAWDHNELLILCPPLLNDFSFVNCLPEGEVECCGDWTDSLVVNQKTKFRSSIKDYPVQPVLGVFTSGTLSGHPRLILYSKENIESSIAAISALYDSSRIRAIFCYPQPFHTFGLILGYVMALRKGIPFYSPNGKYGREAHQLRLQLKDPNLLTLGTPTHFHDLIEYLKATGQEMAPSYSCNIGGAPVTVALWEQVRDVLKIEQPSIGYGCSEASPGISHHPPGRKPREDAEIGFPLSSLSSIATRQEGVCIQGPSLCVALIEKGHLQFPKEVMIRDAIRVRNDGMWIYEGRLDLMFNRGGQKFSLEAIEHAVFNKADLHVVCVAVPHPRLGQDLAFLVKADSAGIARAIEKIKTILKSEFSLQVHASSVHEVSEFPMNASFKLDRKSAQALIKESSHDVSAKIS
jgi:acyl-CoA synthetase (AMP-forming)/AMP-acid ligase II